MSNWRGSSHIFMNLCHRVTECKTAALKKTLVVVMDWVIGPNSSLPCYSTSMFFAI